MFANKVMMVRPVDFKYNVETGVDNEFQHRLALAPEQITERALNEFCATVANLESKGVKVMVLEKGELKGETPDAVFPNNWFATDSKGNVYLFPMKTENRRREVRPYDAKQLLKANGLIVGNTIKVGDEDDGLVLEGTGAIVFDHKWQLAYAALSERCDETLLNHFCRKIDYQPISFRSFSSNERPIYHTNVLMSVGRDFVVACLAAIDEKDRRRFIECVQRTGKKLIDITFEQMEQHFCGNILELKNVDGERVLALSKRAWAGFDEQQQAFFSARMTICASDIETLETVGGGSMRCMLAEVFSPVAES